MREMLPNGRQATGENEERRLVHLPCPLHRSVSPGSSPFRQRLRRGQRSGYPNLRGFAPGPQPDTKPRIIGSNRAKPSPPVSRLPPGRTLARQRGPQRRLLVTAAFFLCGLVLQMTGSTRPSTAHTKSAPDRWPSSLSALPTKVLT